MKKRKPPKNPENKGRKSSGRKSETDPVQEAARHIDGLKNLINMQLTLLRDLERLLRRISSAKRE